MVHCRTKSSVTTMLVALGMMALGVATANAGQGDTAVCALTGVTGTLDPPILAVPATGTAPDMSNDGSYKFDSTNGGTVTCVVTDAQNDAGTGGPGPGGGPGPDAIGGQVTGAVIKSDGFYTNLLLGTGSVAGTAGLSAPVGGNPPTNEFGPGPVPAPSTATPLPGAQNCPPTAPVADTAAPFNYTWTPGVNYTTVGYGIDFVNNAGKLGGGAVTPPFVPLGIPGANPSDTIPDALDVTTHGQITIVANAPVLGSTPGICAAGSGQAAGMYVTAFTVAGTFAAS